VAILDYFCTWNCVLQCGSSYLIILCFVLNKTSTIEMSNAHKVVADRVSK
jgi:hypothetical protein